MRSCEKPGMTNGLVVQISAFGPVHETGKVVITPIIVCATPSSVRGTPDHVRIAAEPRFPKAFRDHRDISAFLFFGQKRAAAHCRQTEDIKVIRGCLENRNLERITQSRHRRGESILTGESVEDGLSVAEMDVARRGEREIDGLFFEMREDVKNARRFSKRSPRRKSSLIRVKIAVFNPMPSVRVITARRVNPGDLRNCRRAKRRSVII